MQFLDRLGTVDHLICRMNLNYVRNNGSEDRHSICSTTLFCNSIVNLPIPAQLLGNDVAFGDESNLQIIGTPKMKCHRGIDKRQINRQKR